MKTMFLGCCFLLNVNIGLAQACCSGGTPLTSNLGIQTLSKKQVQVQLAYDYNTQKDLVLNTQRIDDRNRARNTHSILLRNSFALTQRWSISTIFSLVRQEEKINNVQLNSQNFIKVEGIGDIVSLLQYQVLQKNDHTFMVAGGAKIPIGATNRRDVETSILYNADLQPGTGSWDFIFGTTYTRAHLFKPNLSFSILSTYRWTTAASRFGGQQVYEFGDEWQTLIGFKDAYLIKKQIVNPSILFRYRMTQQDKINDLVKVSNTSGHWVHLVPGFEWYLKPNFVIGAVAEAPLFRSLKGIQLTTTYKINIFFTYNFSFKKRAINSNEN